MTVISELHAQEYRSTHTGHRRHQSRRVGLYLVLRESARERPLDLKSKKDHTVGGENPGERRWEGLFFSSSEISDVSSVGRGAVISRPEEGKRFFPAAYPSTRPDTKTGPCQCAISRFPRSVAGRMPGSGSVDAVTVSRPESPRFDDTRIQDSFCDTSARRSDDSARQWQAKWDVQDSGLKELDIIQQNVKRLESQISDSRSLSRLLGDKVSDSRSLASISSSSGDESFRRLRRADSRQESNSQEPLIKAQVKMSRQLREEGCHLSAKRYILDAWAQACSGADISDNCLFLAASELLESGYLEDDPGELARCLDVAVSVNRFQRETIKVHRSSSRTPDALSRSSVLAHSVDDLPFSEGGDALSVFTGSVIGDDGDTASAQRSKQLEALVSLGIRLSKLVTAPVQVAQGRRFLADALHLAHQHPGINNDATWELVNFIVGEGYMEHVDETLRTTLNNVVSRLHQDDVSPKRLRQEGLAVQGLNACKAQLADEGSVSSVSGRREPENRTYISQDVLLKASPPGGGRDENVCADGHVYGRTPSRAGRLSEIQQANSLVQQTGQSTGINDFHPLPNCY